MPTTIEGNSVSTSLIERIAVAYLLFPNSARYIPESIPTGMPIRLVNPIKMSVPCIAGPMPPLELFCIRKLRLICGAPLDMTSQRILSNGITATITQTAQRTKNRRFLNLRKLELEIIRLRLP